MTVNTEEENDRLSIAIKEVGCSPAAEKMVRDVFASVCAMGFPSVSIFWEAEEFIEFSTGVGELRIFPDISKEDIASRFPDQANGAP